MSVMICITLYKKSIQTAAGSDILQFLCQYVSLKYFSYFYLIKCVMASLKILFDFENIQFFYCGEVVYEFETVYQNPQFM